MELHLTSVEVYREFEWILKHVVISCPLRFPTMNVTLLWEPLAATRFFPCHLPCILKLANKEIGWDKQSFLPLSSSAAPNFSKETHALSYWQLIWEWPLPNESRKTHHVRLFLLQHECLYSTSRYIKTFPKHQGLLPGPPISGVILSCHLEEAVHHRRGSGFGVAVWTHTL